MGAGIRRYCAGDPQLERYDRLFGGRLCSKNRQKEWTRVRSKGDPRICNGSATTTPGLWGPIRWMPKKKSVGFEILKGTETGLGKRKRGKTARDDGRPRFSWPCGGGRGKRVQEDGKPAQLHWHRDGWMPLFGRTRRRRGIGPQAWPRLAGLARDQSTIRVLPGVAGTDTLVPGLDHYASGSDPCAFSDKGTPDPGGLGDSQAGQWPARQ